MHILHKVMTKMICVHYTRSHILLVNTKMRKDNNHTMSSVIPEDFLDILQSHALAYVATIGPKGEPQVSPVWFAWDGTYIRFSMNKIRQRYRNLRREPRIALSITDLANPYRTIEIRGKARLEDDVDYHFNSVVTKKYTGQVYTEQHPNPNLQPGEERIVVVVEPEQAIALSIRDNRSETRKNNEM